MFSCFIQSQESSLGGRRQGQEVEVLSVTLLCADPRTQLHFLWSRTQVPQPQRPLPVPGRYCFSVPSGVAADRWPPARLLEPRRWAAWELGDLHEVTAEACAVFAHRPRGPYGPPLHSSGGWW